MNHLAIKHVLEEAERYASEFREQLEIKYKAIEQRGKQFEWLDDIIENEKVLARHGLFKDLNLDYDSEELEKAMEEADKRLVRPGAATEARAIVSVIDSHRETFDLIAPPMARKLYEEFCLLAEPQPAAEPQRGDTNNHFNSILPDERLTTIFKRLKGEYLADDSDLASWLYIWKGGDLNGGFKPLEWLKTAGLLAVLCTELASVKDNKWKIANVCFTIAGKPVNSNTLKNAISRHNGEWRQIRGREELLSLLQ